ncbi:MAG: hypothetical protein MJ096_03855 [Clostridia bacterium]|nr:hypothetical protein [Clostridia bacterium]
MVGFITKGYGISIHKKNCRNVLANSSKPDFKERLVSAEWDVASVKDSNAGLFEASMVIFAENHIALLAEITTALAEMKVSLLSINTQKRTVGDILINITVGCKNSDHYNSIVSRLRSLDHVISITRGVG